jgi:hypothetical protein
MPEAANPRIATRDIYDSATGELFPKGSVLPDDNSDILCKKKRNGRDVIPGVEERVVALETKIAGGDKPKAGAGQNGQKPAKGAVKKQAVDAAKASTENSQVQEGGAPRGGAAGGDSGGSGLLS